MKKIIALCLALVLALAMSASALAGVPDEADTFAYAYDFDADVLDAGEIGTISKYGQARLPSWSTSWTARTRRITRPT